MRVTDWIRAAGDDAGPQYAAAEAWPGGRRAVMRVMLQRGMWGARVELAGELPVSTVLDGQDAAQAWCVRTAEAALRRLGPVLEHSWAPLSRRDSGWHAEITGTVLLLLTVRQAGGTWTALVELPGHEQETRQLGWAAPELAMDWCERTAAVYLRDAS